MRHRLSPGVRAMVALLHLICAVGAFAQQQADPADNPLRDLLKQDGFPAARPLDRVETEYLRGVARDTWLCIAEMVDEKTGLPYDSSDRGENTSVSNIGVYLTSVIAARDLGLIAPAAADRRIGRTLASVEKLRTWHGFQQCWNSIKTLEPGSNDSAISLLDSGNLAAALMTVEQAAPSAAPQCRRLLDAMDWKWFFDDGRGLLRGGFDTKKDAFVDGWYLESLGTDARLCQFIAIATDAAPPEMWGRLTRKTETHHGVHYLEPGWQGGGLFMQYISGLWLDERDTLMGRSAQNFAYAQILHAREIGAPVWGWSAAASPDGEYLGWGKIKDEVITPHACVLAIDRFPAEVVANLHALEAIGARRAGKGFVDSIDWKTKRVAEKFLMLDQSMLLISLANYLKDQSIRRAFADHPLSRHGRMRIGDYAEPMFAR